MPQAVVLSKLFVKDVLEDSPDFNLVYVEEDETVGKTLQKLKENQIQSMPVKGKTSDRLIGIIDILDLVAFCCTKFSKVSEIAWESYRQMDEFTNHPIGALMNVSGRNQWQSISYDRPLTELMTMFTKPNNHRVFVVNESQDIIGLISQSRVIHFLHKFKGSMQADLNKFLQDKVKNCVSMEKPVQINKNEFVIKAYQMIWDRQISGIAVVDDDGKLVGNISASDLQKARVYPVGELIHDLYQPIQQYLSIKDTAQEKAEFGVLPHRPVTVTAESTMEDSMNALVAKKIHRVYMVDEHQRPQAVVTLRDIIQRAIECTK